MPQPGKDETRDDFLERCIPQLIDEGREQKQAVAICHDMWRRAKGEEEPEKSWEQEIKAWLEEWSEWAVKSFA